MDLNSTVCGFIQPTYNTRTWTSQRPLQYASLTISRSSGKAFTLCCQPSSQTGSATNLEGGSEDNDSSGLTSQLIPNPYEVESLVTVLCDTTSIAEFEMRLGGFRLYVTRDLSGKTKPPLPPSPAPVSTTATIETSNGSASTSSLALSTPVASVGAIQTLVDNAADEGLVILQSPRVGFFRRSRTIKGKRAPPSCKEKQIVKEGQVLCYIEQLGGELPIESDISGEVIKILREDGDPVGYGDALIAILPSFPGIKKLQ